jgi:Heterokaryon incompatibility protein (HET)
MAFQVQSTVLPPMSDSESDVDSDSRGHSDTFSAWTIEQKLEYRPLKENEFRLLVLNPGLPDEPIECFLEHYNINQAKPYQALSYVWGGDSKDSSCYIKVDGHPFQVTKNLKDFLLTYRSNTQCPVLWIDAVCINQSDVYEKNTQIRLMKRVYEAADIVVIWLGPEIEDSTKLAVAQILSLWRNFWIPRLEREGGSEEKALASIQIEDLLQVLGFKLEDGSYQIYNTCWESVHDLLEKPWWSRIWVYSLRTVFN